MDKALPGPPIGVHACGMVGVFVASAVGLANLIGAHERLLASRVVGIEANGVMPFGLKGIGFVPRELISGLAADKFLQENVELFCSGQDSFPFSLF